MKYKRSFQIMLALMSLLVAAIAVSPAQATMMPGYVYSTDEKTPVRDMDGHCVRAQIDKGKEFAVIKECMDSDADGVPDSIDKCPDTPKGVKVDKDGCPIDSDGDGVTDYLDKCPDTPKGVKVDKDGCPMPQLPVPQVVAPPAAPAPAPVPVPAVEKAEKKVSIALEIEFDTGKAVIKPQYDDQIKKVADFMTTYPETTAVIEGHTDNVGKESSNVNLSTRRAESVKESLVKKYGIAASRLTAKGFGSSQPVADNKTPEGRQKNRRINAVIETMTK